MKDVFGKELAVGDRVATNINGYTDALGTAYVIGFTLQKVKLAYAPDGEYSIIKYPRQLAKG